MNNCKKCEHFPVCMWNGQKQDDCGFYKEARPQGKWEFGYTADNGLDEIIRCSVCHRFDTAKYIDGRNSYYDYPAFCKCCGADMRGKEKWEKQ